MKGLLKVGLLARFLFLTAPVHADISQLWGQAGERWSVTSRLPDFSHAGYHSGRDAIPTKPVRASVRDFGATGDGVTDDTAAFEKALASITDGAVMASAGRYRITRMLHLRNRVVLRGQGKDRTILYFPKSLTQAVGSGAVYAPGASWSWSGGFITASGKNDRTAIATVVSAAKRGDQALTLSTVTGILVNDWLRLTLYDNDGALPTHLYADQASARSDRLQLVDFAFQVTAISGRRITMNRPLRTDVRLAWTPKIIRERPTLQEAGIEDLTIEFPVTKYVGHHQELGYNAIDFSDVTNSWVRRIRILNADSGIFVSGSRFCTFESIEFKMTSGRLRTGYGPDLGESQTIPVGGHHGVLVTDLADDNWITDFTFPYRFIHELGVAAYAAGNVFSKGTAVDGAIDHHRRAPYENLFTALDMGEGNRFWQDAGDAVYGPPAGARETFWNVIVDKTQRIPKWALQMNIVGLTTRSSTMLATTGNWLEAIVPTRLIPQDLFVAQNQQAASATSGVSSVSTLASPCDVNKDGQTNVIDIQLLNNQVLEEIPCTADINKDGRCDPADLQSVVNAAGGQPCVSL